jgi:hypothetical protein
LNPHVFILQKYAEAETYQKSQKEKRKGKIKENMIRTIDTTSPRKGTPPPIHKQVPTMLGSFLFTNQRGIN